MSIIFHYKMYYCHETLFYFYRNATLHPPPPHLFTQNAFDKYFQPCKIDAVKMALLETIQRDEMKAQQKQQQANKELKSEKSKTTTISTTSKISSSDIFEDITQSALAVQTFDQSTRYHTVVQEPKLSSISVQDRKWFLKYKKHITKGVRKTSMEEDRFKVSLTITFISSLLLYEWYKLRK